MRIFVTAHAVDQFIARWRPDLSLAEARAHLEDQAQRAVNLRERTGAGQRMWQLVDPPAKVVVKDDPRERVVVTVLPPGAGQARAVDADLPAAAETFWRASSPTPALPPPTPIPAPPLAPSAPWATREEALAERTRLGAALQHVEQHLRRASRADRATLCARRAVLESDLRAVKAWLATDARQRVTAALASAGPSPPPSPPPAPTATAPLPPARPPAPLNLLNLPDTLRACDAFLALVERGDHPPPADVARLRASLACHLGTP